MVNLVKEAQESKKKIILSGMVSALVIIAATPMFVVAGAFPMEDWMRIALIVVGIVVIVIGIAIACILDRDAGAYECPECKTRFVPEMGAYVMGPHLSLIHIYPVCRRKPRPYFRAGERR